MPPLKYEPPTEAIKKVTIHQADGYSPLTPHIIPYFATGLQGGKNQNKADGPSSRLADPKER
jgi:hypothetical protein